MKKLLTFSIISLIAISFAVTSFAANSDAQSGQVRIAVVDLARALNEVNEGKRAKANLEKEFKSKKASLEKMKKDIENLQKEVKEKSAILSQEAMRGKQEEFQRKFMQYQQSAKEFTEELARKEGEMTNKIIGKLRTTVQSIAAKDGYTFVFEKSQGGVVYGPSNADITNEVIKQYNK